MGESLNRIRRLSAIFARPQKRERENGVTTKVFSSRNGDLVVRCVVWWIVRYQWVCLWVEMVAILDAWLSWQRPPPPLPLCRRPCRRLPSDWRESCTSSPLHRLRWNEQQSHEFLLRALFLAPARQISPKFKKKTHWLLIFNDNQYYSYKRYSSLVFIILEKYSWLKKMFLRG